MKVEWRGNSHTNKSSRDGIKPIAIVNHVVAGSGQSCDNWFRSPNNEVGSAHFCVWEDGRITQYVDLKDMAWANGLALSAIPRAKSTLVKSRPSTNPNKYTVSIEHAGHTGKLTAAQFAATVWLHKYIRDEVKRIFKVEIPFNRTHILGHFEIDPVRKPNCPGPDFPWADLMEALTDGDTKLETGGTSTSTSSVLRPGSKGSSVTSLQKDLMEAGYKLPKYGADGSYGDETTNAVKRFQQDHDLVVDGIAGPATQAKLKAVLDAKKKEAAKPAQSTSTATGTHKVVSGDTLSELAVKYKTTVAKIKAENGLKSDLIKVGQVLKIPGAATPVYHTVVKGDTVSELAEKYKVSQASIKSLNKLDSKYTIRLGQKLRIK